MFSRVSIIGAMTALIFIASIGFWINNSYPHKVFYQNILFLEDYDNFERYHSKRSESSKISVIYKPSVGEKIINEGQKAGFKSDMIWRNEEERFEFISESGLSLYEKDSVEKTDIFKNTDLWQYIFEEKKYVFEEIYSENKKLWKFTIPVREIKDEVSKQNRNVLCSPK
jgi:hypothetical protein